MLTCCVEEISQSKNTERQTKDACGDNAIGGGNEVRYGRGSCAKTTEEVLKGTSPSSPLAVARPGVG